MTLLNYHLPHLPLPIFNISSSIHHLQKIIFISSSPTHHLRTIICISSSSIHHLHLIIYKNHPQLIIYIIYKQPSTSIHQLQLIIYKKSSLPHHPQLIFYQSSLPDITVPNTSLWLHRD